MSHPVHLAFGHRLTYPIRFGLKIFSLDLHMQLSHHLKCILKLEKIIRDNLFEDTILSNSELIQAVVKSSFKYSRNIEIPCKVVSDFLAWYKDYTEENQVLVLNNFVSKLSTIQITKTDSELPF